MTYPALVYPDHLEIALVHSGSGLATKSKQLVDLNGSYREQHLDMKGMGSHSKVNDMGLMNLIGNTRIIKNCVICPLKLMLCFKFFDRFIFNLLFFFNMFSCYNRITAKFSDNFIPFLWINFIFRGNFLFNTLIPFFFRSSTVPSGLTILIFPSAVWSTAANLN